MPTTPGSLDPPDEIEGLISDCESQNETKTPIRTTNTVQSRHCCSRSILLCVFVACFFAAWRRGYLEGRGDLVIDERNNSSSINNDVIFSKVPTSSPTEPVEKGQGSVILSSFHRIGFNNQRETLQAAIWAARALGTVLYIPEKFGDNPHSHSGSRLHVRDVFNLTKLNQFVPIKFLESDETEDFMCEHSVKVKVDKNTINPPASADELRQLVSELPTNTNIVVQPNWLCVDAVLEFDGSFGIDQHTFWAALEFTDSIQGCADKVVDGLWPRCSDGMHGAHLRVTDRPGLPLFDASRGPAIFNRTVEDDLANTDLERALNVKFADTGTLVTMEDVFLNDRGSFPLTPNTCVYVATDSATHPRTRLFVEAVSRSNGTQIIMYNDLSLDATCSAISPSILEQAILARVPGRLVSSWHSSWDEYVLHERYKLSVQEDRSLYMAEEELALFVSKLTEMVSMTGKERKSFHLSHGGPEKGC